MKVTLIVTQKMSLRIHGILFKKYVINDLDRELKMMLRNQECRRGETDIHPLFQHHPVNPVTY